jgi:hypothetical protein
MVKTMFAEYNKQEEKEQKALDVPHSPYLLLW